MGGHGTWKIAATVPGKFAAYVPICGGVSAAVTKANDPQSTAPGAAIEPDPYAATAKTVGSTPVWIFHGAVDDAVPVEESRKMAQALEVLKANVRYSEYPGVGHNSWDKAYAEPELVPWLLSHKLRH
jgi:predicted peptidase